MKSHHLNVRGSEGGKERRGGERKFPQFHEKYHASQSLTVFFWTVESYQLDIAFMNFRKFLRS